MRATFALRKPAREYSTRHTREILMSFRRSKRTLPSENVGEKCDIHRFVLIFVLFPDQKPEIKLVNCSDISFMTTSLFHLSRPRSLKRHSGISSSVAFGQYYSRTPPSLLNCSVKNCSVKLVIAVRLLLMAIWPR
jgi:hypothetical protein